MEIQNSWRCGSVFASTGDRRYAVPLMIVCLLCTVALAQYGGGTGTPDDPYLIYTAEQMNAIGITPGDFASHFRLMADIDLGEFTCEQFNLIGRKQLFGGVFDGNGHTISGFSYSTDDDHRIGLFSVVGGFVTGGAFHRGVIQNLIMVDPNIEAKDAKNVGSLVGLLRDGEIVNCHVLGGHVAGKSHVGGLVGGTLETAPLSWMPETYIGYCHAAAEVQGVQSVGGLVGFFEGDCFEFALELEVAAIVNCSATGKVSGQERIGGLAGVGNYAVLTDCYSRSSVSGDDRVGGLLGASEVGIIQRCYASGPVTGISLTGGLLGVVEKPFWEDMAESIEGCYWDLWQSGQIAGDAGLGRTTAQMMQEATFVDWDFDQVWDIVEDQTYPFLRIIDPNSV